MTSKTKTLILGLIMAGGVAFAQVKATDPDVIARQTLMDGNGAAIGLLAKMAKGEVAFDAAAAATAKATLVANAAAVPAKWKVNASDPASKSKAEIWTKMDDFTAYAGKFGTAAAAIDVSSLDGVKAGLGAIGGACKDCHTEYKASS